jgi:tetratricopeptide (TPR) repeat protein
VRLAQDDVEEALEEFGLERALAQPHRLYGREYAMNGWLGSGAALLHAGRHDAAIESFREALVLYPDHPASHVGMALALRGQGANAKADAAFARAEAGLATIARGKPIDGALVRAQLLAATGDGGGAAAILTGMLDTAPPGFAGTAGLARIRFSGRPLSGKDLGTFRQLPAERAR